jgi:hypothetical protein
MFGRVYERSIVLEFIMTMWSFNLESTKARRLFLKKRGMRTAMGSAKWLTVRNHQTTTHALEAAVRDDSYIVCTDVNPDSKDMPQLLVVMGNDRPVSTPSVLVVVSCC